MQDNASGEPEETAWLARLERRLESALKTGTTTRRQALLMLSFAAMMGCCRTAAAALSSGGAGADGGTRRGAPDHAPGDDALDEALERLQKSEPRSKQGLSTHAPMVAEALCALGYPERAVPWVEGYAAPVLALPAPTTPIDPDRWRAALGPRPGARTWEEENPRWGDWKNFFLAELSGARWQDVLDVWVSRLSPGMCSAATHGVIRTAHAVRGLSRRETPQRRGELARGLAYWASSYEELPARPHAGARAATYAQALGKTPLYFEAFGRTAEGRNIVEALRHVRELEGFAGVRDGVTAPVDVPAAVSALTATFARVYLRHGTQGDTIAFIHAVTGPCSLRRIAPHIKPETARAALPYAWQAAAAIYAAFARGRDERRVREPKLGPAELAARAIENGDAHAIKFTEVMLAEHRLKPDPAYLAAAEDAVRRL